MVDVRAKTLRDSLSAAGIHLNTVRRKDEDIAEAAASDKLIRRLYMDKIEQRKREHWAKLLDDRDNTWKAYAYTRPSGSSPFFFFWLHSQLPTYFGCGIPETTVSMASNDFILVEVPRYTN